MIAGVRGSFVVGVGIVLFGCSGRAIPGAGDSGETSTSESTTAPAPVDESGAPRPSTTTSPDTSTMSTTGVDPSTTFGDESLGTLEGSSCFSFICVGDTPPAIEQCDPLADECPDGEKCVWYVDTGLVLRRDAARCIPVAGDVPPFHPCTLPNGTGPDITDDCDASSYCLDVHGNPDRGFCAPYIVESDCSAYPGSQFAMENGSSFPAACLVYDCDPRDPAACAEGMSCMHYPAFLYGSRMCWFAPDDAALPTWSACEYATGCGDGRLCLDDAYLEGCVGDRCCTQWCDIDAPSCDDPSLACERYPTWDDESTLGACVTPGTLER